MHAAALSCKQLDCCHSLLYQHTQCAASAGKRSLMLILQSWQKVVLQVQA
jgi:hypothetical protein